MTTTATTARVRPLPSPTFDGHAGEPAAPGCVALRTDDLRVGDVLRHAAGTFDLVTSIAPIPSETTRQVHVLRTLPSGRTVTCSFWIGEHARRVVQLVVEAPPGRASATTPGDRRAERVAFAAA